MSVWDNFSRLKVLNIEFVSSSSSNSAVIYGNGRNQVEISVEVNIQGLDGQNLPLTYNDLLNQTKLVSYRTGEPLRLNGQGDAFAPWAYTSVKGDYTNAVSYGYAIPKMRRDSIGSVYLSWYVYAENMDDGIDIAVSIDVPGVGEFASTESGTATRNGPQGKTGSTWKSPSKLHVSALKEIHYDHNDVKITREDLGKKNGKTSFESVYFFYHHYNFYISLSTPGASIRNYDNTSYAGESYYFNKYWICFNNMSDIQQSVPVYLWPEDIEKDYISHQYFYEHPADDSYVCYIPIDLDKENNPNSIHLTIIDGVGYYPDYNSVLRYDDSATDFYDQYGNHGHISYDVKKMTDHNAQNFMVYLK